MSLWVQIGGGRSLTAPPLTLLLGKRGLRINPTLLTLSLSRLCKVYLILASCIQNNLVRKKGIIIYSYLRLLCHWPGLFTARLSGQFVQSRFNKIGGFLREFFGGIK